MSKLIINTNPHINKEASLLESIAKSVVNSFKIEGIIISFEEALKITKETNAELKKSA